FYHVELVLSESAAQLIGVEVEHMVGDAIEDGRVHLREQQAVLKIMRLFVVEVQSVVRIIALDEVGVFVNAQERLKDASAGRPLRSSKEKCAINFSASVWTGR